MMVDRRRLLRASPAVGLGITTIALPTATAAASTDGTASLDAPMIITLDDTIAPDTGDDVAYRIAVISANGTTYLSSVAVTVAVTVDDGTNGGAGSPATGTAIDGAARTQHTVTTDTGSVDLSIDLPGAGTYLVRVTTSPAPTNQPDGVTVAVSLT